MEMEGPYALIPQGTEAPFMCTLAEHGTISNKFEDGTYGDLWRIPLRTGRDTCPLVRQTETP